MSTASRRLTIDTLEHMFVYLGCANIPTQAAMDGAIPIESLLDAGERTSTVSCLAPARLVSLPPDWAIKAVWFSGEHLGLSTVQNIHWSIVSQRFSDVRSMMAASGQSIRKAGITSESDAFVKLLYSEIDRFGRFVKFPVNRRWHRPFFIKKAFNPSWLLEFRKEEMRCVSPDSDSVYADKRLSFLAPFLCGLAQSLGSYWQVKTRFDEVCPSLTLLTDPTGVKEFWKLRDVPTGRTRRAALLHWVEQHWRQTRNDPEVEAFVRAHMKGESALKHGKFEAVITPSTEDTLEAQKAKDERDMLKKLKADRRRRRRMLA